MTKYEINKEFDNYADVRQFEVEADEFDVQDGYFVFWKDQKRALTILAGEVRTVRPADAT